jgi:hypothetical protein
MKLPDDIMIYGDLTYRGSCPKEAAEQVTFFARLRRTYPDTFGVLALHPRNEGIRTMLQAAKEKSEGMTTGAPDIVIPGSPAFVCELKRRDHTASSISEDQLKYLRAAKAEGCFTCIALGVDEAWAAFHDYLSHVD